MQFQTSQRNGQTFIYCVCGQCGSALEFDAKNAGTLTACTTCSDVFRIPELPKPHIAEPKKPPIPPPPIRPNPEADFGLGLALCVSGGMLIGWFYFIYDTSINGTHNLGLLQNRELGMQFAIALTFAGFIALMVYRSHQLNK